MKRFHFEMMLSFLNISFSCLTTLKIKVAESTRNKTVGMQKYPGFIPYCLNKKERRICLKAGCSEKEFCEIYIHTVRWNKQEAVAFEELQNSYRPFVKKVAFKKGRLKAGSFMILSKVDKLVDSFPHPSKPNLIRSALWDGEIRFIKKQQIQLLSS